MIDPALLPGEIIDAKYRIERVLGRGGMGVVLLARNVLLGKRVAVKVLGCEATTSATSRLLMEARAAARLESDHAVRVLDVGSSTAAGVPYIVMEYLQGHALSEVLRDDGPAPVELAVHWVLEASEALAEAHQHGIIHRDIKPGNLFLEQRPDGGRRIKVLDFGIAKLPVSESLATTTHPIGSPLYMAPEQLSNAKDMDLRVDVWGIGCVLHELLTGKPPFAASSLVELAGKLAAGSRRRIVELRPELPLALCDVVERCLNPDRSARFPNLRALALALEPFAPPDAAAQIARIQSLRRALADTNPQAAPELLTRSIEAVVERASSAGITSVPALAGARLPRSTRPLARRAAELAVVAIVGGALALTLGRSDVSSEVRRDAGTTALPHVPASDPPTPNALTPNASPAKSMTGPVPATGAARRSGLTSMSAEAAPLQQSAAQLAAVPPRAHPSRTRERAAAAPQGGATSTSLSGAPLVAGSAPSPSAEPYDRANASKALHGPLPIDRELPW